MSRHANSTVIGAFVIGAVSLITAAVIVFGGSRFFTKRPVYVMYFEGSVKGLDVGAPVMFRGVKVGNVKNISIKGEPDGKTFRIPVIVEIDPHSVDSAESMGRPSERELDHLVEQGLRARLGIQSLVTGKLLVELGFFPEEKPRLKGRRGKYREVPTIPSTFEKISQTVQAIPIQDIFDRLAASLKGIERIINSEGTGSAVNHLNQTLLSARKLFEHLDERTGRLTDVAAETMADVRSLLQRVDKQVEPIAQEAKTALESADKTLITARKTLTLEKGIQRDTIVSIKEMAEAIKKTADAVRPAIAEGKRTLANIETLTANDSDAYYRVNNMLKELSMAARAIRTWAEYLERHPEALIRGKGRGAGR